MKQSDLFLLFTHPLEEAGIPYMATGSIACMMYGVPRFTHDLDLVLELLPGDASKLQALFPSTEFYCPPEEVIRIECYRDQNGHFNLIHHDSGFKADVYLHGSDEFHAWAIANKRRMVLDEPSGLWVAPPEYVIIRKLEYFKQGQSPKHLEDIRGIIAVSPEIIDRSSLTNWAKKRGVTRELNKLFD